VEFGFADGHGRFVVGRLAEPAASASAAAALGQTGGRQ
jgi:hypothetical protein